MVNVMWRVKVAEGKKVYFSFFSVYLPIYEDFHRPKNEKNALSGKLLSYRALVGRFC